MFDIRLSLEKKARFCADGHKVPEVKKELTYSSVPSRHTVRVFFMLVALNDLDILASDIHNAYLISPIEQKYYMWTSKEFPLGYRDRPAKIVRALYGLPVAGFSFRMFLQRNLIDLGYMPTKGDPDLYIRAAVKPNREHYYERLAAYSDDLIVQGINPKFQMDAIGKRFTLKKDSIKEPERYLGADISKLYFDDDDNPGKARWALSSSTYTDKAIKEVERELEKKGLKLPNKPKATVKTPMTSDY